MVEIYDGNSRLKDNLMRLMPAWLLVFIATRRRMRGYYDDYTLLLFSRAWEISKSPKFFLRYAMFRRDLGLTLQPYWVEFFLKLIYDFDKSNRWFALALIAEINKTYLATIPSDWLKEARLPVLAALSFENGIKKECCLAKMYRQQEAWRNEFSVWLNVNRSGGICVVGNAASLRESGQGNLVDAHAVVVRFNKFKSEDTSLLDLGGRIDVWVMAPGYKGPVPTNVRWVIVTGPDVMFRLQDWRLPKIFLAAETPVLTVPLIIWREMVASLESPPSAGVLVLNWINNMIKGWDGVMSVGIGTGLSKNGRYHIADRHHIAASRHNWLREQNLMESWYSQGLKSLR